MVLLVDLEIRIFSNDKLPVSNYVAIHDQIRRQSNDQHLPLPEHRPIVSEFS